MQKKVINYIMKKIKINNKNINKTKLQEIEYGLLGIYTIITKTFVILLLSIILGIMKEFLIFLLFYSILRSVGYGAHAKSNINCWFFSTLLLLGLPYLFSIIKFNLITIIIIWLLCFISYVLFCPADTEKRPMINKFRKLKFKFMILIFSLLYLVLIIKFKHISNYILAAMILQAFLSSPLGYIIMGQKSRFNLDDLNLVKHINNERS